MSDTEEVPKQEEAMETEDAKESTPAPVEANSDGAEEAVAPPVEKSPSKSPAKSPAKSPKKTAEAKQTTPSKKTSPAKTPKTPSPTKTKKKEEIDKEHDEDEEEDEEEKEVKKGLFDLPVVVEGKRKRESVSRLKVEAPSSTKHKAPVAAGSGTALEDIPFILHQLEAEKKVEELRHFYRICYGSKGKHGLLRKELKKFNGFEFAAGSEKYKSKHATAMKMNKADISYIRRILGVAVGKSKEEEVSHVLDFLLKPHDEGRKVPLKAGAAKRKSSTAKTPKKSAKRGESSKKKTTSKETVDTESDEEKSEESEEEEEEEVKTPKKAPAKRKAATTPKGKTPAKKAKKAADSDDDDEEKEKEDDHSVTSSSDTSSEKKDKEKEKEKKTDAQSPTDAEVKAKIAELLKGFDLTTVSMKQMVIAVCDAFPGQKSSLSERTSTIKAWIKDAIKEDEEEA